MENISSLLWEVSSVHYRYLGCGVSCEKWEGLSIFPSIGPFTDNVILALIYCLLRPFSYSLICSVSVVWTPVSWYHCSIDLCKLAPL